MELDLDKRSSVASSITKLGINANILLSVLKLLAGLWGHSSAMVADAFHSLSDLLSDLIVLAGFKLACKPADKTHPYGHGKIETFVALVIGSILLLVGLGIIVNSVLLFKKITEGHSLLSPGKIALLMALVSIAVKELMFRKTMAVAKKIESSVLIANAWHHRSDALSSLAAFLGIAGAHFLGSKWLFLDPLAALVVAFLILKLSLKVILEALNDLLEASLNNDENIAIHKLISAIEGVKEVHALRTRRLGPSKAIEAHVCVDPSLNVVQAHDIATNVENRLKETLGQEIHVAIHVEPFGYDR